MTDAEISRRSLSLMWWFGQAIAAFLGVSAVGASGSSTVGLVVFYALSVLVDIRELLFKTKGEHDAK